MAIIRIKHSDFETKFQIPSGCDTLDTNEWSDEDHRVKESGWNSRYEYEANLIGSLINENIHTILEIGSGPGVLSEMIHSISHEKGHNIKYDLVDKPFAKKAFEKAGRKGRFFVKDISNKLDVTGLESKYDLIIANDVLEHLFNPSQVVQSFKKLVDPKGLVFISVPNWRMGHQFIYRGLFDYDNFLYFMYTHGFTVQYVFPSPLITPDYPKISSEDEMNEELRRSWNWYFVSSISQ